MGCQRGFFYTQSQGCLRHAAGVHITISGHPGDDAKPYQEKAVAKALLEVEK
jgi:hypothetical protein